MSDLRRRNLEVAAQAGLQGPEEGAFLLEPPAVGKVEVEDGDGDNHELLARVDGSSGNPAAGCPGLDVRPVREAATSSVTNASMHVADLHVLVAGDADAALEAALDLGGVVLEAPERADLPLVDDAVVAEEADGRPTAG